MSEYLKKVRARFVSLGKAAINAAIPAVVISSINMAFGKIEQKLHQLYLRTIRNSAITLVLNVIGMLVLIFQPFTQTVSKVIAYSLFTSGGVFWLIRTILYCRNYGKITIKIVRNVLQKRSLTKGISQFIVEEYPLVTMTYAGIDIASEHLNSLKEIPRLDELVHLFIRYFRKRVILYAGIVATYTLLVYWVLKPILIKMYS